MGTDIASFARGTDTPWPRWFGLTWWSLWIAVPTWVFGWLALPVHSLEMALFGPRAIWDLAHVWLVAALAARATGAEGAISDWVRFWMLALPIALIDWAVVHPHL